MEKTKYYKRYIIIVGILALSIIIGIANLKNSKNKIEKMTENEYQTDESISFKTLYTEPYLPKDFRYVEGTDLSTGLVIEDSQKKQYVWIEVPKTMDVYQISGIEITQFTDKEYLSIEKDLHIYTSVYRNNTSYMDEYPEDIVEKATGLTKKQYLELKQKMLKSTYQNGGFYIGRYETGVINYKKDLLESLTETPVIQKNVYPYGYITCSEAQKLADKMILSPEYTSSLLFGVQWDLVLKYLETKGFSQEELHINSTNWGNCYNSLWNITNVNTKYYLFDSSMDVIWQEGAYGEKTEDGKIFLSTGASDVFMKQNIYDLAGNSWEWTLEYSSKPNSPCTIRGGSYGHRGDTDSVSYRMDTNSSMYFFSFGFRVAIY